MKVFKVRVTNNCNNETITYVVRNKSFVEHAIGDVMEDLSDNYASFLSSVDTASITSEIVETEDPSEIRYIG